jgi:hypothetical protein
MIYDMNHPEVLTMDAPLNARGEEEHEVFYIDTEKKIARRYRLDENGYKFFDPETHDVAVEEVDATGWTMRRRDGSTICVVGR